jgi:hypothetical protein
MVSCGAFEKPNFHFVNLRKDEVVYVWDISSCGFATVSRDIKGNGKFDNLNAKGSVPTYLLRECSEVGFAMLHLHLLHHCLSEIFDLQRRNSLCFSSFSVSKRVSFSGKRIKDDHCNTFIYEKCFENQIGNKIEVKSRKLLF